MLEKNASHAPRGAARDPEHWITLFDRVMREGGFCHTLGQHHLAVHRPAGSTLVVTFETFQGIESLDEKPEPVGWALARAYGWSSLMIGARGDTWFRDENVFAFFDTLSDDGFFEGFDQILFYGAGPCGYASAAYSVAAPGATVVAIQPQATLDPSITDWEDRFPQMRRTDFSSRYGYAPDMLDACAQAFVIYDPNETLDAMHASLFTHPAVQKFRMRHLGGAIQSALKEMQILEPILFHAMQGDLTSARFASLLRARRKHTGYLRRLFRAAQTRAEERPAGTAQNSLSSRARKAIANRFPDLRFPDQLE